MTEYQEETVSQLQSEAVKEAIEVLEAAEAAAEGADDLNDASLLRQTARRLREAFAVGK